MTRARALGALLVASLCVSIWWALATEAPSPAELAPVAVLPGGSAGADGPGLPADSASTSLSHPFAVEQVERVAEGESLLLRGVILDPEGSPVHGATVSWTPEAMHVDGSSRSKGTWQKALEACRYCVSDEAGRFEVVGAGQAEDGVLWATAPGYEATFEWVRSEFEGVKTLRFTKERALEAQVIHGGAGNLGGAVLIQRGYVPNAGPWSELSAESQARHLLIRQHVLPDGAGSRALVELPPLPSPTVAWCEQDDLASEERALDLETTFDLTLRPTFILDVQVEGDVPFPDARMRVLVDEAATARPLGVIRLGVDGVGGGRLPVVNGGQLTAFLIGEGVPLSTKTFDSPDPGGQVALTFGSEGAESITWRFLDPGGEPVSEVSASLGWDDVDGAWIQVPTITISDEDGLAHTPLPAAGEVWLGYLHQDYLADFSGPFEPASLPRGDDGLLLPVEFTLTPKARLTGRVRGGGEYLLEYKLYGWEAGEPASNQLELDYTIGENGIFLMERQAGPIYLSATAEGYAQSSSVQVAAPKGLSDEILIEVQEPLLGRGRVLDALTLEPIPGAQVWIGVTEFGNVYAWMPDALVTDSNGSFEARAFSSDQLSNAWVDAEGYASVSGLGEVDMAGVASEVNFGDVLLERASWTDIEVHGLGEEDKAWIQVEGGSDWIEMAAHGEVWTYRLEGQVGGRLSYGVANDDGTLWASRLLYQSGRGPWKDVVHLGGTTSLQLSLGDLGAGFVGCELVMRMGSLYQTTDRTYALTASDIETGRVQLEGLTPGVTSIILKDHEMVALGGVSVELVEGTEVHAELQVDCVPLRVELVSLTGEPLPGAIVNVSPLDAAGFWSYHAYTDANGVADLGQVPFKEGAMRVMTQGSGHMSGQTIRVPDGGGTVRVAFDSTHELSVRLHDRGTPLGGLALRAAFVQEQTALDLRKTDPQGQFFLGPVSDADYFLLPTQAWVWAELVRVHSVPQGATPVEVELRRIGDFVLNVQTSTGSLGGGMVIDLHSEEYDTDVATWVADGRLEVSSASMKTDSSGRLTVRGLPNGPYTWSIPALGLEGAVTVPALGEVTVEARQGQ